MSFLDEVLKVFGQEVSPAFRVLWLGDGALYVEGVKSIKSYSQEKVELNLKNGGLKITGVGLFLKKYCAGDVAVCGTVKSIDKV